MRCVLGRAGNGVGNLPEEHRMKTRLLITTTAALLAGTVFAAAQSVQSSGDREKAGASQGQMQRPAGKEAAGKEQAAPNRNAQANPAQGQQRGREQPTTSGQGSREPDAKPLDNKSEGGGKSQTQRQPDNKQQEGQAQRPGRTEGQAPREEGQIQNQREPQQGQNQRQPQQGQNQREPERNQQGAREGERGGTNVSVNLTTEQRTKIRDTVFKEKDAPRVGKVDFSIKEGTVIPRSVKIVEIPQVIIDIHPDWRRYRYFIVNEQIVIVEPDTLRIVAIVDV
jgi:hypothetical protein